ncbi:MAG: putative Ig domain-containing protein [Verrucomicrobiales bacterium]|nr:putative Ig domain-containing protein [Verrucomicrobiales bacterium]MCP5560688.1 putative Ig domain-containing protein [Verrucomicrobiaceae bacterium]
MAIPVLSPITSIHSIPIGTAWYFQPALAPGSSAATSWAATGLPPGLTLNTSTGLVSGVANGEGVFNVRLQASNGSGASAWLVFPMGVRATGQESGAAKRVNINLQTGAVYSPDNNTMFRVKSGDLMPVAVGFEDEGKLLDIPMLSLINFSLKEADDEPVMPLNDGLFQKIGAGVYTRYVTFLDLRGQALRYALENWENPKGTNFVGLAEVEWVWFETRPGFPAPQMVTRTSNNFPLATFRELRP